MSTYTDTPLSYESYLVQMFDYLKEKDIDVYDAKCSGFSSASSVYPMWAFVLAATSITASIISLPTI